MKGNILIQSQYYKLWVEHTRLRISTKNGYILALKRFEAFLLQEGFEGKLDFDRFHASRTYQNRYLPIQRSVIDRFIQYLRDNKRFTNSMLKGTVQALKHFFGFLFDMDLIQHNPMLHVPTPKHESPIQNTALSKDECIELLKAAIRKDPFYRQEFVLIWFMLITGLRVSEVCFLRRSRLHLDRRIVQITEGQKTHKRAAAISKDLAVELERYINHPNYRKEALHGNEFVFHHRGKRLSPEKIRSLLRELSKAAGLSRDVRPHDLRRTAGYLMQANALHIVNIQHQLGHRHLGTTLRYVPPLSDMRKILEEEQH